MQRALIDLKGKKLFIGVNRFKYALPSSVVWRVAGRATDSPVKKISQMIEDVNRYIFSSYQYLKLYLSQN